MSTEYFDIKTKENKKLKPTFLKLHNASLINDYLNVIGDRSPTSGHLMRCDTPT